MSNYYALICNLPDEIINIIKSYVRPYDIMFTNKSYYTLYHKYLRPYIIKNNIENYIRNIIKRDCDLVFERLIYENINKWIIPRDFIYKNHIYKNYIYFLIHYCIDVDSDKCYNMITNILNQKQLCQNRHKKNIIKCIK